MLAASLKLYLACVTRMAQLKPFPIAWRSVLGFAYKINVSVGSVVIPLMAMLNTANEWRPSFEFFVFVGDIEAAFDALRIFLAMVPLVLDNSSGS